MNLAVAQTYSHSLTVSSALERSLELGLARIDAQVLLLFTLQRRESDRAWLVAHDRDPISHAQWKQYQELVQRRVAGVPTAYLTGRKEFYQLEFLVDARVLIPRPETELLVDWVLQTPGFSSDTRVLDMGTGCGAVALALKSARPRWRVDGIDISRDAILVAQANCVRLGRDVRLRQSSWYDSIDMRKRYHLIVSNPPYVAEGDAHLQALRYEPQQALVAGPDGLSALRIIVAGAQKHLRPGGMLIVEHGYDQGPAVKTLMQEAGFSAVSQRRDIAGIVRCTAGQLPAPPQAEDD